MNFSFDFLKNLFSGSSDPEMSPAVPLIDPVPFYGEIDSNTIDGWIYIPRKPLAVRNRGVIVSHGGWVGGLIPTYAPYVNGGYHTVYLNFEGEPDFSKQDPNRDAIELYDTARLMMNRFPQLLSIDLVGVSLGGYRSLRAFGLYPHVFRRVVNMIGPINMHDPKHPYDWSIWVQNKSVELMNQAKAFFDKAPDPMQMADIYKKLASRILCLYGSRDPICPPSTQLYPFLYAVRCPSVVIQGASHNVHRTIDGQTYTVAFLRK